jgi:GTPase SAR1 family protein
LINDNKLKFLGIILVFDVTSQDSFEGLKKWLQDVQKYAGDRVVLLAVGNKCDMVNKRVVDSKIAKVRRNYCSTYLLIRHGQTVWEFHI